MAEKLLTRYYIFEPTDESLKQFKFVGTVDAHDRTHAANLHYKGGETAVKHVSVSENSWKVRVWRPKVEQLEMPSLDETAAAGEDDDASA